jgi:hypothetical protein
MDWRRRWRSDKSAAGVLCEGWNAGKSNQADQAGNDEQRFYEDRAAN